MVYPRVREDLRDNRIVPGPEDFNRAIYFNEEADLDDLSSGFLKGDVIVKVCGLLTSTNLSIGFC